MGTDTRGAELGVCVWRWELERDAQVLLHFKGQAFRLNRLHSIAAFVFGAEILEQAWPAWFETSVLEEGKM